MKKTTCSIAVLALALAGCASSTPKATADTSANCDRTVSVMVIGGKVDYEPDPVCVKNQNAKITWELVQGQRDRYQFTKESIVVGDSGDEFPNCKMGAKNSELDGTWRVKCDDRNSVKGAFPYIIRVYWFGSSNEAANSDPTIVNQ
jgi:hypothetical protein